MDAYLEQAAEQRSNDFRVVRDWVFEQIEHNLPQFAHDIACLVCGSTTENWRDVDIIAVEELRSRMYEAIEEQTATHELALLLQSEAEEDAREAEREREDDAAYARRCEQSTPNIPVW